MKRLLLFITCIIGFYTAFAQETTQGNFPGAYRYKNRLYIDSLLLLPTQNSATPIPLRDGALRYNPATLTIQLWKNSVWENLISGAGIALDSVYRSNDTLFFHKTNGGYLPVSMNTIQNQYAGPQNARAWINGHFRADSGVVVKRKFTGLGDKIGINIEDSTTRGNLELGNSTFVTNQFVPYIAGTIKYDSTSLGTSANRSLYILGRYYAVDTTGRSTSDKNFILSSGGVNVASRNLNDETNGRISKQSNLFSVTKTLSPTALKYSMRIGGDDNTQFAGKLAVGYPFSLNDTIADNLLSYIQTFKSGQVLKVNGRASASAAIDTNDLVIKRQFDDLQNQQDTMYAPYKWVVEKNTRAVFSKIIGSFKGSPSQINMFNIGDSYTAMVGKYFLHPLSHLLVDGGQVNNIAPYASGVNAPLSGRDLQLTGTSTNYSYNLGDNAHWPSGLTYTINNGGIINWNSGGANATFTTLKVFYFKEPGGGILNVVVGGSTVASLDCSSPSDTVLQVYTYKQPLAQAAVSLNATGGKSTVVESHIIDTTKNGVDLYTCGRFGIRMDSMFMYNTAINALKVYLKSANVDIMTWEAKEFPTYPDGTTYGYRLNQLADVLDSTMHNGCKIWIGSSPVKLPSEDIEQIQQNDTLFRIARERGYIYWEGYTPLKNYDELVSLKWGIADGVHLSDTAHAYRAGLLWKALGFDNTIMGMGTKAVNDRTRPSNLGANTTIGANVQQQLKFNTDVFGLDWKLMYRRLLSFTDTSGNVIASFSPQAGNNMLMSNWGIGAANKRFILKNISGVNIASFIDSTQTNNNLPIASGFIMPGSYTTSQLNGIPAATFPGAITYVSNAATTRPKMMWAMHIPWDVLSSKWVPMNHVYQAGSASYLPAVAIYDTAIVNVTGASLQLTEGALPGLAFWVSSSANTYAERMRLLSTGNLLIGSTTDSGFGEKLQVNGRISASRAIRGSDVVVKDQLDSLAVRSPGTPTFSPSISVNDILGTGYSVSISGNGDAMKVTITTGTGITTNGTIGNIVFNTAFGSIPITVYSASEVGSIGAPIGFNATSSAQIIAFCKETLTESKTYHFNLINRP